MAYEGILYKRQIDNLVYIQETGLQFNGEVGVNDTDPIILDATEKFSKNIKGAASENPMADKSDRSDNYRVYNPTLKFSGVISNDTVSMYPWTGDSGAKAQQLVQRLEKIFEDKKLVEIYMPDGLRTINCLLTSLDISRDVNWGNGFYIEITAKQIQLVYTNITTEPVTEDKDIVSGNKDGGDKTGTTDTANTTIGELPTTTPIPADIGTNPK